MRISAYILFLAVGAQATAREYQLNNPALSDGYGYSGTIVTDGRTGTFSSPDPIIDWTIHLITPGVDGESSETLTPQNSELNWLLRTAEEILVFDEVSIFLDSQRIGINRVEGQFLRVRGSENDVRIAFHSTRLDFPFSSEILPGQITATDIDDSPFSSTATTSFERTLIAVRPVPEPASAYLSLSSALLLTLRRSRRSALEA